MAKTVYVDQDQCTGCEACVELCPGVFEKGTMGTAQVKNPEGASVEEIQEAMDLCAARCIHWESDDV